ncbi:MAG: hypothetical protein HZY76_03135 [Anaerolineae bacterium]|nr:MAG: hypothetical protein HZY76_03135 [Anaerolineae bacterium]
MYGNIAYIVADTPTQHGLQVFDLTQLRAVTNPPRTFTETAHYAGFVAGHSLWMNETTGYLYVFRSVGMPARTACMWWTSTTRCSPALPAALRRTIPPVDGEVPAVRRAGQRLHWP